MLELGIAIFVLFMIYIISVSVLLRKLDRLEKRSIELSVKNAFLRIKLKDEKTDVSDI